MLIKGFVVVMLLLILISLFSALVLLFRGGDRSGTAKALTWRVGLSLTLFLLLMAGFYFGIIPPGGLSSAPGR